MTPRVKRLPVVPLPHMLSRCDMARVSREAVSETMAQLARQFAVRSKSTGARNPGELQMGDATFVVVREGPEQ
jgi:hypothetical protein